MARYRKEVAEVIRYAEERGFKLEGYTGSGHWLMKHPLAGKLIIPSTPSGYSWRQNTLADIRRLLKRAKTRTPQ